jgi:hypothetical protein
VFEVGVAGGVAGGGGADTAGEPWDHVVVELIETYPFPSMQFVGGELDSLFVVTQAAAVEDEQQFVAIPVVRCPVDDEKPGWCAVEPEFLGDLTTARGGGGFTPLDLPPGISKVSL